MSARGSSGVDLHRGAGDQMMQLLGVTAGSVGLVLPVLISVFGVKGEVEPLRFGRGGHADAHGQVQCLGDQPVVECGAEAQQAPVKVRPSYWRASETFPAFIDVVWGETSAGTERAYGLQHALRRGGVYHEDGGR